MPFCSLGKTRAISPHTFVYRSLREDLSAQIPVARSAHVVRYTLSFRSGPN
jgi:hypothetical protein